MTNVPFVVHQFSLYGGSDLSVSWWHCSWLSRFRHGSDLIGWDHPITRTSTPGKRRNRRSEVLGRPCPRTRLQGHRAHLNRGPGFPLVMQTAQMGQQRWQAAEESSFQNPFRLSTRRLRKQSTLSNSLRKFHSAQQIAKAW